MFIKEMVRLVAVFSFMSSSAWTISATFEPFSGSLPLSPLQPFPQHRSLWRCFASGNPQLWALPLVWIAVVSRTITVRRSAVRRLVSASGYNSVASWRTSWGGILGPSCTLWPRVAHLVDSRGWNFLSLYSYLLLMTAPASCLLLIITLCLQCQTRGKWWNLSRLRPGRCHSSCGGRAC